MSIRTSETHPIRVDFLAVEGHPELARLGMTFAPGKKQKSAISGVWDRDLAADLRRLREEYSADILVSLVEDFELTELGIGDIAAECARAGIALLRFPIRDVSVPASPEAFAALVETIAAEIKRGRTVVVHCKGGLGRAGLTAACTAQAATDFRLSAADSITAVRQTRPGTIETREQEDFVRDFGQLDSRD